MFELGLFIAPAERYGTEYFQVVNQSDALKQMVTHRAYSKEGLVYGSFVQTVFLVFRWQ